MHVLSLHGEIRGRSRRRKKAQRTSRRLCVDVINSMAAEFFWYACYIVLSALAIGVSANPEDLWVITYAAVLVYIVMAAVAVFKLTILVRVTAGGPDGSDLGLWVVVFTGVMILAKLNLEPAYMWISSWIIVMVGLYNLSRVIKVVTT